MECIAVINQKGGVGKTATAANLGAALCTRGKRVLLIDLDPQGHLTAHFGLEAAAKGTGVYEALTQSLNLAAAMHAAAPNLTVIPSGIDLAAAEVELVSVVGREVILRDMLAERDWPFDFVVIDCPPSLGILTLNALCAATRVIIPVQPHFLALQGVGRLLETISLVSQRLNKRLKVAGMLLCMFESATKLSGEVVSDLSAFLESSRGAAVPWSDARIFGTRIRRNIKLAECPSYGQTILQYAPRSTGASDYLAFADEVITLLDAKADAPSSPSIGDESSTDASRPQVALRVVSADAATANEPAVGVRATQAQSSAIDKAVGPSAATG